MPGEVVVVVVVVVCCCDVVVVVVCWRNCNCLTTITFNFPFSLLGVSKSLSKNRIFHNLLLPFSLFWKVELFVLTLQKLQLNQSFFPNYNFFVNLFSCIKIPNRCKYFATGLLI